MQFLNLIKLRGVVGSVRTTQLNDSTLTTIQIATEYGYALPDGTRAIDTDWHQLKVWNGPEIKKGDKVEVAGRLRYVNYMNSVNKHEYKCTDIYVHEITVLPEDDEMLSPQEG